MMARLAAIVAALFLAAPSLAAGDGKVPLPDETHINTELIAGKAGDILRHTCPKVHARMLVVWTKLFMLRQYALDAGYSEAQVKAFLDDPKQQARVKAAAEKYLEARGAKPGDVESYCQVGREEVAKGTLLGQIIWVSK